ncbi:MAG: AAA domain-containing protein [Nitrospiraceae bacterium]
MMSIPNTISALLEQVVSHLEHESSRYAAQGGDRPLTLSGGRLSQSVGSLQLYQFSLPPDTTLGTDIPVTIVPPDEGEPTEGHVLLRDQEHIYIQTFDLLGEALSTVTLVPDGSGFLTLGAQRLTEMAKKADLYTLGPAERLIPLFEASQAGDHAAIQNMASTSVLTTLWQDDISARRQKISTMALDLIRGNKRILLVSPDHHSADVVTGVIARAMKGAGLTFKSWLTRYELAIEKDVAGVHLQELSFEAQMHQFYAKSRADKASLRRKYERFRELTPLLAYKAQKQRDLDEVRLLEWRLLTHLSEIQTKIKTIDTTLTGYETLPLWKRLSMQAVGKNVESLRQYREIHEGQIGGLKSELDIAKQRIDDLIPEAAVPKELRPEFQELKEDIQRLGGTKKIREMLAAAEDTNRQAFVQNRRVLITTAARVLTDPLFRRVRFDVLIVDEAPRVPSAFLIAAAGLVRERIVLSGDFREIRSDGPWSLARDLLLPRDAPIPAAS